MDTTTTEGPDVREPFNTTLCCVMLAANESDLFAKSIVHFECIVDGLTVGNTHTHSALICSDFVTFVIQHQVHEESYEADSTFPAPLTSAQRQRSACKAPRGT